MALFHCKPDATVLGTVQHDTTLPTGCTGVSIASRYYSLLAEEGGVGGINSTVTRYACT